jgi:SAM-dependent methyltransferase
MIVKSKSDSVPVSPGGDDMTIWDKVALTKWGKYVADTERGLVCRGIELAGQPASGIDLGCGSGRWSRMAAEAGWRMTCIDVDQRALSICQRNLPEAKYLLADPAVQAIPCQTSSAGLLLCIEVGPVIESDWFIPEVSRVLIKGGVLVAVAWNRRSWRGAACRFKYRLTGNPDGNKFYNHRYASWKARLRAAGFQVVYEQGLCWGPARRSSNSFVVPLYVTLERLFRLNRLISWSPWIAFIARKK